MKLERKEAKVNMGRNNAGICVPVRYAQKRALVHKHECARVCSRRQATSLPGYVHTNVFSWRPTGIVTPTDGPDWQGILHAWAVAPPHVRVLQPFLQSALPYESRDLHHRSVSSRGLASRQCNVQLKAWIVRDYRSTCSGLVIKTCRIEFWFAF